MGYERLVGFACLLAVGLVGTARAEAPALLPVQGYLAASSESTSPAPGTPLDGEFSVRFRLYDAPEGGGVLHDETLDVTVVDGYFTVYLGDAAAGGNALDLSTFRDTDDVYLGIKVDTDAEATPRLQLASTAFAAQATYCSEAGTLDGRAASDFASSDHTHSFDALSDIPATFAPSPHTHSFDDLTDVPTFEPTAHTHAATEISSGTLDPARFSAYADLTAEGVLDNSAPEDLLTRAQADARFAPVSHVHSGLSTAFNAGAVAFTSVTANTVLDLQTLTVNCPAASNVLLAAAGNIVFFGLGTTLDISISTSATTIAPDSISVGFLDGTGTNRVSLPFALNVIRAQPAGTTTYHLTAQRPATFSSVSANIGPKSFTGVCIRN